jgi:toxin ParE1/3/4
MISPALSSVFVSIAGNRASRGSTIYKGIAMLQTLPNRGRAGRAENTRELVFPPWPYIVVYEIIEDQVQVLRIRHASQNWP